MTQEISRREVLNNLIRFRDNLLEMRGEEGRRQDQGEEGEHEEKEGKMGERTYKVLLNRKTGDMHFAQKISDLEYRISQKKEKKAEDWKEIQITVRQKSPQEAAHFEVRDAQNHSLKPSDIDPLAWKVASETLDTLNKKAKEVKEKHTEMLPEEAVLQDLSSIRFLPQKGRIEELPGWMGAMSRIDAEKRLTDQRIGTYLLREGDEITLAIAFHFSEENRLSIHPYVLTVVEKDLKISDILLLQTDKGWTRYHDDPNLKDPELYRYFSTPEALLHSLHKIARHPLSSS